MDDTSDYLEEKLNTEPTASRGSDIQEQEDTVFEIVLEVISSATVYIDISGKNYH